MIGKGKKAKLRNHASVKYQVEVHKDYWRNICEEDHITDPLKKMERIKKEKENIKNFVSGIENSGKVWITGYYIDPNGREVRMVRINVIETGKEGVTGAKIFRKPVTLPAMVTTFILIW